MGAPIPGGRILRKELRSNVTSRSLKRALEPNGGTGDTPKPEIGTLEPQDGANEKDTANAHPRRGHPPLY